MSERDPFNVELEELREYKRRMESVAVRGAKFVPLPAEAGQPVAMTNFQGRLYLACQYRVYRLLEDGKTWAELLFVDQPGGVPTDSRPTP